MRGAARVGPVPSVAWLSICVALVAQTPDWTSVQAAPRDNVPFVMTHDAARGQLVLISSLENGTWLGDGAAWSRAAPAHRAPLADALVCDRQRARIVAF